MRVLFRVAAWLLGAATLLLAAVVAVLLAAHQPGAISSAVHLPREPHVR